MENIVSKNAVITHADIRVTEHGAVAFELRTGAMPNSTNRTLLNVALSQKVVKRVLEVVGVELVSELKGKYIVIYEDKKSRKAVGFCDILELNDPFDNKKDV